MKIIEEPIFQLTERANLDLLAECEMESLEGGWCLVYKSCIIYNNPGKTTTTTTSSTSSTTTKASLL